MNLLTQDLEATIGRNQQAFQIYNLFKTKTCLAEFNEEQTIAFRLVPHMLHTQEPRQFSYIGTTQAPMGICNYHWKEPVEELLPKYFPAEHFQQHGASKDPKIEFLSLMGSIGSVAYTDKSDFDYWCCVRDDLDSEEVKRLEEKCQRIEVWSEKELGVEVHFFLTTPELLRNNDFGELSKESCGSALGKLLKEEYFRGSLLLAGKIPYWWIVPPGCSDDEYQKVVEKVEGDQREKSLDFVDIGNIASIPMEELVGGGMWQLNKAIHSPFKSALKMALLMVYSDPEQTFALVAGDLKRQVQTNPNRMEFLDPYQFLVDRTLGYYEDRGETQTVQILQRCFFLKIAPQIFRYWSGRKEPVRNRDTVMLRYCKSWEWSDREVERLEDFDRMPVKHTLALKEDLEQFMISSLKELRERAARCEIEQVVREEDFRRMTQRLDLVFNRRPGQLDPVYAPYHRAIRSARYTFREVADGKGKLLWRLHLGAHERKTQIIRRKAESGSSGQTRSFEKLEKENFARESASCSDLVGWMLCNKLLGEDVQVGGDVLDPPRFSSNLKALSVVFNECFTDCTVDELDSEVFDRDPIPCRWILALNLYPGSYIGTQPIPRNQSMVDIDAAHDSMGYLRALSADRQDSPGQAQPELAIEVRTGGQSGSHKNLVGGDDPFNAWEKRTALLSECLLFEQNSWGEAYVHEEEGACWPVRVLSRILTACRNEKMDPRKVVSVALGSGRYDEKRLRQRFEQLVGGAWKLLGCRGGGRFLFEFGGLAHGISMDSKGVKGWSAQSFPQASGKILCDPNRGASLTFDTGSLRGNLYQRCVSHSANTRVDIFLCDLGGVVEVMAMDEWGVPVWWHVPRDQVQVELPWIAYTLMVGIRRIRSVFQNTSLLDPPASIRIFWVGPTGKGSWKFDDLTAVALGMVRQILPQMKAMSMKLSAEDLDRIVRIYAEEGRYAIKETSAWGDFTRHVASLMKNRASGTIPRSYLTDLEIDFLARQKSDYPFGVSAWLGAKCLLEGAMALTLRGVTRGS